MRPGVQERSREIYLDYFFSSILFGEIEQTVMCRGRDNRSIYFWSLFVCFQQQSLALRAHQKIKVYFRVSAGIYAKSYMTDKCHVHLGRSNVASFDHLH